MAREAGLLDGPVFAQGLERFFHMAQAAEREACAKVCESHKSENFPMIHNNAVVGCVFAIRARGQE